MSEYEKIRQEYVDSGDISAAEMFSSTYNDTVEMFKDPRDAITNAKMIADMRRVIDKMTSGVIAHIEKGLDTSRAMLVVDCRVALCPE